MVRKVSLYHRAKILVKSDFFGDLNTLNKSYMDYRKVSIFIDECWHLFSFTSQTHHRKPNALD